MTDSNDVAGVDDAGDEELDFAAVREREQRKREVTKKFVVEYDDGARAVWKYRMVDNLSDIADQHTRRKPTRSGQDDEFEITDRYAFARDVLTEGLVDAPDGFEITKRCLQEDITDELMDDLVESIRDFSTMDEVTVRQFRGLGVRE